jgi:hypothetical protein
MKIQEVIRAINQMLADGVIDRYAIGGAVGATFYLEPVATIDVDVFVTFKSAPGSLLVSPQPIFDYLKAHGGAVQGEYIVLAEWPVQFLPTTFPLVEEALDQALTLDAGGVPAKVFSAEHLAAIALETGRSKDKARLLQFLESGVLNTQKFGELVTRHGLSDDWQRFGRQFLRDAP